MVSHSYLYVGLLLFATGTAKSTRPNIVLIVADDMGWNDISLHGSDQIPTPNIDLLTYSGVGLQKYYTHCVCTPSRAALLTGKYAYVTGMQGYPLTNSEDRGLPIEEKILPQYLKELGYATHLVGKWHVGSSRSEYLPTRRGFDTHFGHRGGFIDYYEYTAEEPYQISRVTGFNLYRNETVAWDVEGYITDVYNQEALSVIKSHDTNSPLFLMLAHSAPHGANIGAVLQAPPHEVRAMRHVELSSRRMFAAMMKKLDDSVGDVIEALEEKGILNNTIVVFISDNGAMTSGYSLNYGSNWPLRGLKMSPFEGGVRVAGSLWLPQKTDNNIFNGYFHAVDWLPTLLKAIGANIPSGIDGFNLWDNIITNEDSKRHDFFEIDDYFGFSSIHMGDYKLVTGEVTKEYSNYQGGGSFLGVIGEPPTYIDAIKTSKAYKSFAKIGRPVSLNDIKSRENLIISCDAPPAEEATCYPKNGTTCLFNIKEDPCERKDLSKEFPDIVTIMLERLSIEKNRLLPRTIPLYRDPRSRPFLHNFTWGVFADS